MTAADFRRIALSLEGAEEGWHMGAADFRAGGRIFATLASEDQGYGNLMLTPEQQADFVRELPDVFLPVRGGWERMGATHIRLAKATEDVLAGALRTASKLRVEEKTRRRAERSVQAGGTEFSHARPARADQDGCRLSLWRQVRKRPKGGRG